MPHSPTHGHDGYVDGHVEVAAPDGVARLATREITVHDRRAGDGPTLVLLHEALGSIPQWRGFPERLAGATGLPVLLYDRRGHGRSDPLAAPRDAGYLDHEAHQVLPQVLARAGVDRPVFVGHSDGGTIALLYAATAPATTVAVITIAAHVHVDRLTLAGIRDALTAWRETDLRARLARHHGDKAEALFFAWADTWLAPWWRGWTIVDRLRDVTCPVLAAQGENDQYGLPEQVRAIVGAVGGPADGWLIPGCGHAPHLERGDAVAARVRGFLQRAGVHAEA